MRYSSLRRVPFYLQFWGDKGDKWETSRIVTLKALILLALYIGRQGDSYFTTKKIFL
nr:MAG TPA: hypothetical protein [Caudoviricetes sp.]